MSRAGAPLARAYMHMCMCMYACYVWEGCITAREAYGTHTTDCILSHQGAESASFVVPKLALLVAVRTAR